MTFDEIKARAASDAEANGYARMRPTDCQTDRTWLISEVLSLRACVAELEAQRMELRKALEFWERQHRLNAVAYEATGDKAQSRWEHGASYAYADMLMRMRIDEALAKTAP